MREAYPLEVLLRLREDAIEDAKRAHAEQVRALEAARLHTRTCQQALDAHQQARTTLSTPTTAAEAQTQHAWHARRRAEAAELFQALEAAQAQERARQAEVAASHARIHASLKEAQPTQAHHERWEEDAARAARILDERETE